MNTIFFIATMSVLVLIANIDYKNKEIETWLSVFFFLLSFLSTILVLGADNLFLAVGMYGSIFMLGYFVYALNIIGGADVWALSGAFGQMGVLYVLAELTHVYYLIAVGFLMGYAFTIYGVTEWIYSRKNTTERRPAFIPYITVCYLAMLIYALA